MTNEDVIRHGFSASLRWLMSYVSQDAESDKPLGKLGYSREYLADIQAIRAARAILYAGTPKEGK